MVVRRRRRQHVGEVDLEKGVELLDGEVGLLYGISGTQNSMLAHLLMKKGFDSWNASP